MARRWTPDAIDAQREAEAAASMEQLFGLDTEVKCTDCSSYCQPGEIHCRVCHGHHKAGDDYTCGFRRRCAADEITARKRWARLTHRGQ